MEPWLEINYLLLFKHVFSTNSIVESPCPIETEDPAGFSTRQYVLHELGYMLRVYDASDPTGREALKTLITDVLTGKIFLT